MVDSFSERVAKVFGSLPSSNSRSSRSSTGSPWSLTGDEVEKREWRRDKAGTTDRDDDTTPCSSSFDGLSKRDRRNSRSHRKTLEDDLDDLSDDEDCDVELGGDSSNKSVDGADSDEWNIRSSIGLDRTLDNEEEEDEYDRVALGRENAGEFLYVKDAITSGSFLSSNNVLNSLQVASRDARANRSAARLKLIEDDVLSEDEDGIETIPYDVRASKDSEKPKSILKRKQKEIVPTSQKRVKFNSNCKTVCKVETAQEDPRVPDYLLNPSRYTRYNFNSPEVEEDSNDQAYTSFLEVVKNLKPKESSDDDVSKPVMFIPKK